MSRQEEPRSERGSSQGRTVDTRQLWSGGAATAVVAALIALAGILVCRWLLHIPVLAPRQDGAWGDASTAGYAIAAAALAATAIMHLLLLTTPRPQMFFTWITGLATVIAVLYPFSTTAPLSQKADEMIGQYDAAVIDKENAKPHVVKRMDRPHVRVIPEWFGGGTLPRQGAPRGG